MPSAPQPQPAAEGNAAEQKIKPKYSGSVSIEFAQGVNTKTRSKVLTQQLGLSKEEAERALDRSKNGRVDIRVAPESAEAVAAKTREGSLARYFVSATPQYYVSPQEQDLYEKRYADYSNAAASYDKKEDAIKDDLKELRKKKERAEGLVGQKDRLADYERRMKRDPADDRWVKKYRDLKDEMEDAERLLPQIDDAIAKKEQKLAETRAKEKELLDTAYSFRDAMRGFGLAPANVPGLSFFSTGPSKPEPEPAPPVEIPLTPEEQALMNQARQKVGYEAYQLETKEAQEKALKTGQPVTVTQEDIRERKEDLLETKYAEGVPVRDQKAYDKALAETYTLYTEKVKEAQDKSLEPQGRTAADVLTSLPESDARRDAVKEIAARQEDLTPSQKADLLDDTDQRKDAVEKIALRDPLYAAERKRQIVASEKDYADQVRAAQKEAKELGYSFEVTARDPATNRITEYQFVPKEGEPQFEYVAKDPTNPYAGVEKKEVKPEQARKELVEDLPEPTGNALLDFYEGAKAGAENLYYGAVEPALQGMGTGFASFVPGKAEQQIKKAAEIGEASAQKQRPDLETELIGLGITAGVQAATTGKTDVRGEDVEKVFTRTGGNIWYTAGNIGFSAVSWLFPYGKAGAAAKAGAKAAKEAIFGGKAAKATDVVEDAAAISGRVGEAAAPKAGTTGSRPPKGTVEAIEEARPETSVNRYFVNYEKREELKELARQFDFEESAAQLRTGAIMTDEVTVRQEFLRQPVAQFAEETRPLVVGERRAMEAEAGRPKAEGESAIRSIDEELGLSKLNPEQPSGPRRLSEMTKPEAEPKPKESPMGFMGESQQGAPIGGKKSLADISKKEYEPTEFSSQRIPLGEESDVSTKFLTMKGVAHPFQYFSELKDDAVAFTRGKFGRTKVDVYGKGPDFGLQDKLRRINNNPNLATHASDSGVGNPAGYAAPKFQKEGMPYLTVSFKDKTTKKLYVKEIRKAGYYVEDMDSIENGILIKRRENDVKVRATPSQSNKFWDDITDILSKSEEPEISKDGFTFKEETTKPPFEQFEPAKGAPLNKPQPGDTPYVLPKLEDIMSDPSGLAGTKASQEESKLAEAARAEASADSTQNRLLNIKDPRMFVRRKKSKKQLGQEEMKNLMDTLEGRPELEPARNLLTREEQGRLAGDLPTEPVKAKPGKKPNTTDAGQSKLIVVKREQSEATKLDDPFQFMYKDPLHDTKAKPGKKIDPRKADAEASGIGSGKSPRGIGSLGIGDSDAALREKAKRKAPPEEAGNGSGRVPPGFEKPSDSFGLNLKLPQIGALGDKSKPAAGIGPKDKSVQGQPTKTGMGVGQMPGSSSMTDMKVELKLEELFAPAGGPGQPARDLTIPSRKMPDSLTFKFPGVPGVPTLKKPPKPPLDDGRGPRKKKGEKDESFTGIEKKTVVNPFAAGFNIIEDKDPVRLLEMGDLFPGLSGKKPEPKGRKKKSG
jgi:hypothetical protein